ncbi:MAG: DMT family transporter [Peptostreptococcaceae bacterium]
MKKYIWEIGLILVAIIWGSGFVGTKFAIDGGLTAYQVITCRFLVASILINIIFFKTIKENIDKKSIKMGVTLGIFLFLAFVFQTVGIVYTTASKNAFISAVNVVIVPFIGYFVYKRKLDKLGIITSITTLIGIAILSLEPDFSVNIGDVLTLICAFGFAFHIFYTGEYSKDHNPIVLTSVQFITVAILSFTLQFVIGQGQIVATKDAMLGVLYLGVFSTTLCFLGQTICQKRIPSSRAAIILSTEAIFGMIFSVLMLGEILTIRTVIGSLIIFISILVSENKDYFLNRKS